MQYFGNDAESGLQHYHAGRLFGAVAEAGIDFKHLADTLDCSRSFHQVGIIYDDGQQRWLVRPLDSGAGRRDIPEFLPLAVRQDLPNLAQKLDALARVRSEHPASDGSERLLIDLPDGQMVETVLLPRVS